jgi:glycosyltransferase involved in cell wall biosynthesis
MTSKPILTIAIPTYNRAFFLDRTLGQLHREILLLENCYVEVLVSNNRSEDHTQEILNKYEALGLIMRVIYNSSNIGSDKNIAQCFNEAIGNYVLILGDDDLFVDGALKLLITRLKEKRFGVVCMRSYGFDHDFRKELPPNPSKEIVYEKGEDFLKKISPLMTLISGCVIHRTLLENVDANKYCGENLVQVHLVIQAALKAQSNLYLYRYMIAVKRNNSGGYEFAKVFVENFGKILDRYNGHGLTQKSIDGIESRMIMTYLPFYFLKQRFYKTINGHDVYGMLIQRYRGRFIFLVFLYPILKFPRTLALLVGSLIVLIGRLMNGDLMRGFYFLKNKIVSFLSFEMKKSS